ncbi:hypothetical protein MK805_09545 [Shimazuella sp. AN120528]|uniref:hypothetical protein n=1 Tax=Shimazuella soli TaxID=1892854 RepID=UPI001F114F96|nr:hypothetical protein [Shimazuella soli]MCH5585211.1 hypothetical protein [Shimazuella soli]
MGTIITITNGLAVFAFLALIVLVILISKEGKDERAQLMGYKLFRFLLVFLWVGLALVIFVTGWKTIDYTQLRVCITTLMSLTIILGLGYWVYLSKKL